MLSGKLLFCAHGAIERGLATPAESQEMAATGPETKGLVGGRPRGHRSLEDIIRGPNPIR